jgi:hypothetical protein
MMLLFDSKRVRKYEIEFGACGITNRGPASSNLCSFSGLIDCRERAVLKLAFPMPAKAVQRIIESR